MKPAASESTLKSDASKLTLKPAASDSTLKPALSSSILKYPASDSTMEPNASDVKELNSILGGTAKEVPDA